LGSARSEPRLDIARMRPPPASSARALGEQVERQRVGLMHQRQCLSVISSVGFSTPLAALLTTMSMRSNSFFSSPNISSTLSGRPTLALTASARAERAQFHAERLRFLVAVVVVDDDVAARRGELVRGWHVRCRARRR